MHIVCDALSLGNLVSIAIKFMVPTNLYGDKQYSANVILWDVCRKKLLSCI